jgi:hypothetical protein
MVKPHAPCRTVLVERRYRVSQECPHSVHVVILAGLPSALRCSGIPAWEQSKEQKRNNKDCEGFTRSVYAAHTIGSSDSE